MIRMTRQLGRVWCFTVVALACACRDSSSEQAKAAAAVAAPIDVAECAACGMVVREQPAPRAQLVHRDGERAYFCSIGDLVIYLRAPSPHGDPVAIFVEVTPADEAHDPTILDTRERPWVPAESATYLVGIDRPNIMGPPVLVYDSEAAADDGVARHGGTKKSWAEVARELIAPTDGPHLKE